MSIHPKEVTIPVKDMPPFPQSDKDTVVPPPEHRDDKDKNKPFIKRNIAIGAAVTTVLVGGGIAIGASMGGGKKAPNTAEAPSTTPSGGGELTPTSVAVVDPTTGEVTFSETTPAPETESTNESPYFITSNNPEDVLAQWCSNFVALANTDHHLSSTTLDQPEVDAVTNLLVSGNATQGTKDWAHSSLLTYMMGISNPALYDNNVTLECEPASKAIVTAGGETTPSEFSISVRYTEIVHTGGYDEIKAIDENQLLDFAFTKEQASYNGQDGETWKVTQVAVPEN